MVGLAVIKMTTWDIHLLSIRKSIHELAHTSLWWLIRFALVSFQSWATTESSYRVFASTRRNFPAPTGTCSRDWYSTSLGTHRSKSILSSPWQCRQVTLGRENFPASHFHNQQLCCKDYFVVWHDQDPISPDHPIGVRWCSVERIPPTGRWSGVGRCGVEWVALSWVGFGRVGGVG